MKASLLRIVRGSQGIALVLAVLVTAFLFVLATGAVLFSWLDLRTTGNARLATQGLAAADAGLHHALAAIPWAYDFDGQLNCTSPPCTVVPNISFGSGFSYTVSAKNDEDGGGAKDDLNNVIILNSVAVGPKGARREIEAYVRRSATPFAPPASIYINAASASPRVDSSNSAATGFFDLDNGTLVTGYDTSPTDLNDLGGSQTSGPKPPIWGIATTSDNVTNALTKEYTSRYSTGYTGTQLHDIVGVGAEPSIGTTGELIDVDAVADKFFNHPAANKFLSGLQVSSTSCPSAIRDKPPAPISCKIEASTSYITLGTSSEPQIIYIKDDGSSSTFINGNVTGYGVIVFEGRTTIRGDFKFYGLVIHKRSHPSHYISLEDSTWIYGGVVLGSFDEGDGMGKKARFGVKDYVRIFSSSQALDMVRTRWGDLLPKPARIFAWLDK